VRGDDGEGDEPVGSGGWNHARGWNRGSHDELPAAGYQIDVPDLGVVDDEGLPLAGQDQRQPGEDQEGDAARVRRIARKDRKRRTGGAPARDAEQRDGKDEAPSPGCPPPRRHGNEKTIGFDSPVPSTRMAITIAVVGPAVKVAGSVTRIVSD